jgi:hypothetical protein
MQGQETFANATLNLFGTAAAVFVAVLLMVLVVAGFEPVSQLLDVQLPVRQLLTGRSLHALALSGRSSLVIVRSYMGQRAGTIGEKRT